MDKPTYIDDKLLDKIAGAKYVHIVTIGTKPDIIKQAPIYHELKKKGEVVILCHTGQHYDYNYSGGVEEEFGLEVDIRLAIDGGLSEKTAQMIERFGKIIYYLLERGITPIPYVHGDTSTASAIAYSSMIHRVACVHVEAGIRTITPKRSVYQLFYSQFKKGRFDWDEYYSAMQDIDNFTRGSMEPYPEQVNTRMIEPASGFYATPVNLTRDFLIKEGFDESRIEVVGNTVADVTLQAIKDAAKSDIFSHYPQLEDGHFIMMSIHRRENILDESRFLKIIELVEKIVAGGDKLLFLSLLGTESAIDAFNLRGKIDELREKYPNEFIYSAAWPFHRDIIAAMQKCSLVVSDSGGFQEEANIVGVPNVTIRFGSDRGESFIAGANVPAPPIDSGFMYEIVKGAIDNRSMRQVGNIYGENVARRIVDEVLERLDPENGFYITEEKRLGF